MSEFAAIPGTVTTLRVPPRVLLVGRSLREAASLGEPLINEGYVIVAEVEIARALAKLRSTISPWIVAL